MIEIALIIFLIVVGFFTLYLTLLTALGFLYNAKAKEFSSSKKRGNQKKHCFAVIVPAHNEEQVIAETVSNLVDINYPKELFHVFVVADNCTDKTSSYALRKRVTVIERENEKFLGKGYALEWCFKLSKSGGTELYFKLEEHCELRLLFLPKALSISTRN